MNRRSVLIATAALSLIALPSAAMAYEAPGVTVTVTDATPALSAPVSLTITGAQPNEAVTLTVTSNPASLSNDQITIAGTKSLTKNADASGAATFSVSFGSAGVFTAVATDSTGASLGDQVLTVAGGGAATNTATDTAKLPITGSNASALAIGAGALVVVGGGAVVLTRRRRASQNA